MNEGWETRGDSLIPPVLYWFQEFACTAKESSYRGALGNGGMLFLGSFLVGP